jgi:hypothetical protein
MLSRDIQRLRLEAGKRSNGDAFYGRSLAVAMQHRVRTQAHKLFSAARHKVVKRHAI